MSTPDRNHHQRRPATIAELSERALGALNDLYDENKPFKHYLRIAQRSRKDARDCYSRGDLENAFIYFARAATLVLDKLPMHREFYTLLNPNQRSNLNLNGTDMLEDLGDLKRQLTKRYEEWMREHPDGDEPIPSASSFTQNDPNSSLRRRIDYFPGQDVMDDVDELTARERGKNRERDTYQDRGVFITPQPLLHTQEAKKEAIVVAAVPAGFIPLPRLQNSQTNVVRTAPRPDSTEQRYIEIDPQYQYEQQKEMRRPTEEALGRRAIRRREEAEGIMRRQKEAEDAARAARRPLYPPLPVVYTDSSNPTSIPPSHIAVPNPESVIQSQVPPQPQEITPSYLSTLLTKLSKLRETGASMVNDDTTSLLCGLLDLHDAAIISEVATASGGELFVDFLVHLLRNGSLAKSSRVVQDANRKARRLMFKLISKIDVIPKSLFITDVEKDPQAIVAGGFGNVFKGKRDGQLVALKMLYKGHRAGDSIEKNFYIEALTWQSLSHRFILPFLGIYEEGTQLFLVSPFMTNGALRDWRKEHTPVRVDEIQRLLLEVAEGVQYIHSDGIVHGDLHGGNVLIDSEFHCQITDFGSTRHSEATVTRSTTALAVNFAAPELFGSCAKCGELECNGCYEDPDGERHRGKTIETDVYAFGCLYYAIFFDTVPFRENNYLQVIRHVANGVRPKRLNDPRMADYTWNLVSMCWKSNPSERLTMEEIVTMLTPTA